MPQADAQTDTPVESQEPAKVSEEPTDVIFPEEAEEKAKESKEPEEKSDDKPEDSPQEPSKEEPAKEKEEEASEEAQPDKADKAREAFLKRRQTRQTIAKEVDKHYGPKSQEQLVDEGMSDSDAKVEALRQEMVFREERNQVAELNASLQVEAQSVINDFPIFDSKSPEYDPDFAEKVQAQFQRAARLQTDDNGIVINAEESLYDFYASMAGLYKQGQSKGTAKGQKDTLKMMSRAESPSSGTETKSGEEDPLLAGFDRVP